MTTKTKQYVRSLLCLMLIASFTLTGFAQNPDFTGKWKLNESSSTLGAEFSFAPISLDISQESNLMTVERVNDFQGEEFTSKSAYTLDGKESMNVGFRGAENISIAEWNEDGTSLTVTTSIEMQDGGEFIIKASYALDEDKLVVVNAMEGGPMGDRDPEKWVFDKQ